MRQGSKWYKREPLAFLDGVEGMGPELIGAYAYLIDLIYARDGFSPRDDKALAGRIGCSLRKVTSLVDELIRREKIIIRDGLMTCKHAEDHASTMRARSERGAKAGRASGEKRSGANKNNNLREQDVQTSDQQKKIENRIGDRDTNVSLAHQDALTFDDFWKLWPNKVSKDKARKNWSRLSKPQRQAATDALKAGWFQRWQKANPTANPIHPPRYLSEKRWQDELGPSLSVVPELTDEQKRDAAIENIKSGKDYRCRQIGATQAQALVDGGYVTHEEAQKVGVL